jgi:hypothetical protein
VDKSRQFLNIFGSIFTTPRIEAFLAKGKELKKSKIKKTAEITRVFIKNKSRKTTPDAWENANIDFGYKTRTSNNKCSGCTIESELFNKYQTT